MIKDLLPELLVGLDYARLHVSPVYYGVGVPHGSGKPVILVPGALASDCSMLEMRLWLGRLGYKAYTSGIGRMDDCPDIMRDKLLETIDRACDETRQKVTLIGHSLGGMIARGAALKRSGKVERVIMLAAPFRHPRAHPLVMKAIGLVHGRNLHRHLHRTDNSCIKCFVEVMRTPIGPVAEAAIYPRNDPVVHWYDCTTFNGDNDYEVTGTHIGLVANPQVYQIVADLLAR